MTPSKPTPPSKAPYPFWLDGSYDRDQVEACRYHPAHRWLVIRLGDVLEHPRDPDELHVICQGCQVPRCDHSTEPNPCILPRHHPELHLFADGTTEDASEWPGSQKPTPPDIPIISPFDPEPPR